MPKTMPLVFTILLGGVWGITACDSSDTPFAPDQIVRIELAAGGCGGLKVDTQCQLTVTVFGPNGQLEVDPLRIRWESLNQTIATVDFEGEVRGVRAGAVVIRVGTVNGLVTDQVALQVGEADPEPPEPDAP